MVVPMFAKAYAGKIHNARVTGILYKAETLLSEGNLEKAHKFVLKLKDSRDPMLRSEAADLLKKYGMVKAAADAAVLKQHTQFNVRANENGSATLTQGIVDT